MTAHVLLEGPLEKRGQAILGKWEAQWFRLSASSLDFFASESQGHSTPKGRLQLDQVTDITLEDGPAGAGILNVSVGDRKVRLRAAAGGHIDRWHQQLKMAVASATSTKRSGDLGSQPILAPVKQAPTITTVDSPRTTALSQGTSTYSGSDSLEPELPRTRIEELHLEHQRRNERLEMKRIQSAEEEMRDIEESAMAARGINRRPAVGSLAGKHASERLYQQQKMQQEKLRLLRAQKEESEMRAIEIGRWHARPTRQMSMMLSSREGNADDACQRLFSDSFRRSRDLEVKRRLKLEQEEHEIAQNLAAIRLQSAAGGFRPPDRGDSKTPRWQELHELAEERKLRLQKRREELKKQEQDRIAATRVNPPEQPEDRRTLDAQRINELHQEHLERQQRKREASEKQRLKEAAKLEKEIASATMKYRRAASITPTRQRKEPLWQPPAHRQRPSVRGSMQMPIAVTAASRLDTLVKGAEASEPRSKSVGADSHNPGYALVTSIETAVSQRCIDTAGLKPTTKERRELSDQLQNVLNIYRDAANFQERDSGYAALCLRPSQRLVGSHLLCDPDRFARRVEPDSIRQVESDLETLLRAAQRAQEQLKACIAPGVDWPEGAVRSNPTGVPSAMFALDSGCRSVESAQLQAQVRYGPALGSQCARQLLDIAQLQLVFASCDLIQAGIEHLIQYFEVVMVTNYYAKPTRLGGRYVEVLVVIHVDDDAGRMPHICQLRLEHVYFHKGRVSLQKNMDTFYDRVREVYRPHINPLDLEKVVEVARMTITSVPESQRMRAFRCHLIRRYGSTVCAWRGVLGNHRVLQFLKLQELCQSLKIVEQTVELWEHFDSGCGGTISLWDFDPEACSSLLSFRSRALARTGSQSQEQDAEALMEKLTYHVVLKRPGCIEVHEFQRICKPLGYSSWSADKVFANLDICGGVRHPAAVSEGDLLWMLRLCSIVDIESVSLQAYRAPFANLRPRTRGPPLTRALSSPSMRNAAAAAAAASPSSFAGGAAFAWGASPTFDAGHSLTMASPSSQSSPIGTGMRSTADREELEGASIAPSSSWPSRRSRILPGDDEVQPTRSSFAQEVSASGALTPRSEGALRQSLDLNADEMEADEDDDALRNLDMSAAAEEAEGDPLDNDDQVSLGPPEGAFEHYLDEAVDLVQDPVDHTEESYELDEMLKGQEGIDGELDEAEAEEEGHEEAAEEEDEDESY
mmetsp:Transcript_31203/g.72750  ORF Transcript_31203/g.72750 Transcript_31203/m.72750 type:complete len:1208 (+) Transcript_31203:168-3791(+)